VARDLAIDLGTANTLIYVKGRGVQLDQPTVIAINERTGAILAMGDEAYAMIGRTPGHIVAVRPMRGGAISDFDTTSRLIRMLLQRVTGGRLGRPRVLICVPSAITEVERRAVQEATVQAGARTAYLIEEPMAAAIGAGLPVHEPTGHLVVDVGGGTTEVACISLGGIVAAKAIRVAGFDMDAAIAAHVRREYAIVIGERTAEQVKLAIGSAWPQPGEEEKLQVTGRELATGLPKTVQIGDAEVREALKEPVGQIVQSVVSTLAEVPPELAGDVLDKGIYLAGGASMLRGLHARVAHEAQVAVHQAEAPLACVVLGAGRILEDLDELAPLFTDEPARR
jgi:rod shape-determining protein MreB and related proteins